MAFFEQAITVLQTLVIALGAGLGIWGVINLLEGYGNDNPGANFPGPNHQTRHWRLFDMQRKKAPLRLTLRSALTSLPNLCPFT